MLKVDVSSDNSLVNILAYGKPRQTFILDPQSAEELAVQIIEAAQCLTKPHVSLNQNWEARVIPKDGNVIVMVKVPTSIIPLPLPIAVDFANLLKDTANKAKNNTSLVSITRGMTYG